MEICAVFNEIQSTVTSHRKACIELKGIQDKYIHRRFQEKNLEGEQCFLFAFIKNLNHILAAKKSEVWAEKSLKFVSSFLYFCYEKASKQNEGANAAHDRFIEFLIKYLLQGIGAKEKFVRVRVCALLSSCLNSIDEISDDLWVLFRDAVTERLIDKEAAVRAQAVHALSRFQADESIGLVDGFLELLQYDPSADVRKAVLSELELSENTLPLILERARDSDPTIRRFVYKSKLLDINPHFLNMEQREFLIGSGLRDRDEAVKKSCLELLFGHWIKYTGDNLVEFLVLFNITGKKNCEKIGPLVQPYSLGEEILKGYYTLVPKAFAKFEELYFENLTHETALIIRTYCEFVANQQGLSGAVQDLLPEITRMTSYLETYVSLACEKCQQEEENASFDFILLQLILLARLFDYSDEVGRRNTIQILKNMLVNPSLSDSLVEPIVLTLQAIFAGSENNLIEVIRETICDMKTIFGIFDDAGKWLEEINHDEITLDDAENPEIPIQRQIKILAYARSLDIIKLSLRCIELLSTHRDRAQASHQASVLFGLMNDIIIPAVNSNLAIIQFSGIECLSLMSFLHKPFAIQYLSLFMEFFEKGAGDAQLVSLKTLFDILGYYGVSPVQQCSHSRNENDNAFQRNSETGKKIVESLMTALYHSNQQIQNCAVEGFSKLLLLRILEDEQILEGLVFLYFHPSTRENLVCRQILSFFIQAFASSNPVNQRLLASISVNLLVSLMPVIEGNGSSVNSGLTLSLISHQLVMWTDSDFLHRDQNEERNSLASDISLCQLAHWIFAECVYRKSAEFPEYLKLFSGILNRLHLTSVPPKTIDSHSNIPSLSKLLAQTGLLIKLTSDKSAINNLKKFAGLLIELESGNITAP